MKIPETKDFQFKFTLNDEDGNKGLFTGYASVFGAIDSYGDVVEKGAFKKSIKERNPLPMLWSHSVDEPIGIINVKEDPTGLKAEGHLNLDVPRAVWVRSLMKQGAVTGLSIGYETLKSEPGTVGKTNVRRLQELRLWEVSPVVFPACREAQIADVKSASVDGDDDAPITLEPLEEPGQPTPEPIVEPESIHSAQFKTYAEVVKEFRESIERGTNA